MLEPNKSRMTAYTERSKECTCIHTQSLEDKHQQWKKSPISTVTGGLSKETTSSLAVYIVCYSVVYVMVWAQCTGFVVVQWRFFLGGGGEKRTCTFLNERIKRVADTFPTKP